MPEGLNAKRERQTMNEKQRWEQQLEGRSLSTEYTTSSLRWWSCSAANGLKKGVRSMLTITDENPQTRCCPFCIQLASSQGLPVSY